MRVRVRRSASVQSDILPDGVPSQRAPVVRTRKAVPLASEIADFFGFQSRLVAHDTEGTGLVPYGAFSYWGYVPARPFAWAYCDARGNTSYYRWEVDPRTRRPLIDTSSEEWRHIQALHASQDFVIVGHNIGYDMRMNRMSGAPILGDIHDTMILAHVMTGGDELMYGLKPLADKYCAYPDDDEKILEDAVNIARRMAKAKGWLIAGGKKEVERGDTVVFAGSKPKKADYWLAPADLCEMYAVGDVRRTMLLFLLWFERCMADERSAVTYAREMQLFRALRRMEDRGTRVDPIHAAKLVKWYNAYATRMRTWADANGAAGINFRSPKQLCRVFYDERGLPPVYTKRGIQKIEMAQAMGVEPDWADINRKHRSLGKDQLAEWGARNELTGEYKDEMAKAILEWRAAKQSISSFLNIYEKFWYPEAPRDQTPDALAEFTRRMALPPEARADLTWNKEEWVWVLHPNYNQTGAVTGRMTCSDPNLQQVASATTGLRKADIPSRPRECFGPRPGCLWYLPDYSQVEVWLFAFLSGEPSMQSLLLSGHDFHSGVASRTFTSRPDYKEREKYYRKLAKLIMFGKLYGGGVGSKEKPGRMTKLLQMPFDETKAFIESFDEEFAGAAAFMKRMAKEAKKREEAYNIFGRRYVLGKEWAYKVVNYLIQGAAADILKNATARLDWMLQTRWEHLDARVRLINSIHDEFMIEVPYTVHSRRLMYEIIYVMQMDSDVATLPVPLPVGMKIAKKRWSHTQDVDIPAWVKGGVPRGEEGTEYFRDLARHMQDCPYTQSYDGAQRQFARTRIALGLCDVQRHERDGAGTPRKTRRGKAA
jgi:DNA polymerase I-like protein with 3'-5' exonuclease and polymerase domains